MPSAPSALAPLEQATAIRVRQLKEWGEILTGWQTRNRYQVLGPDGAPFLLAGESDEGFGAWLLRGLLKNKRPFTIEVKTPAGDTMMRLVRPWRWFLSRLDVVGAGGEALGAIQQRFRVFSRRYDILSPGGSALASLEGPFFRPWTFFVRRGGVDVGKIQKKWSGLGKELFTTADNFGVEFSPTLAEPEVRRLVLAATFLIDFVHFERRD